jgi:hypothetical protein
MSKSIYAQERSIQPAHTGAGGEVHCFFFGPLQWLMPVRAGCHMLPRAAYGSLPTPVAGGEVHCFFFGPLQWLMPVRVGCHMLPRAAYGSLPTPVVHHGKYI